VTAAAEPRDSRFPWLRPERIAADLTAAGRVLLARRRPAEIGWRLLDGLEQRSRKAGYQPGLLFIQAMQAWRLGEAPERCDRWRRVALALLELLELDLIHDGGNPS
jgi:non-ribosomal peptide synthetase component F